MTGGRWRRRSRRLWAAGGKEEGRGVRVGGTRLRWILGSEGKRGGGWKTVCGGKRG